MAEKNALEERCRERPDISLYEFNLLRERYDGLEKKVVQYQEQMAGWYDKCVFFCLVHFTMCIVCIDGSLRSGKAATGILQKAVQLNLGRAEEAEAKFKALNDVHKECEAKLTKTDKENAALKAQLNMAQTDNTGMKRYLQL